MSKLHISSGNLVLDCGSHADQVRPNNKDEEPCPPQNSAGSYFFIVDQPLTAADVDAIAPPGSVPVSSK